MSSHWYYGKMGERYGPVSSRQLRELASSGEVELTDLVWKEGMTHWQPAATIKGLLPEPESTLPGPPPLPTAASATPSSEDRVSGIAAAVASGFWRKARDFYTKLTATLTQTHGNSTRPSTEAVTHGTPQHRYPSGATLDASVAAHSATNQFGDHDPSWNPRKIGLVGCGAFLALFVVCGLIGSLLGPETTIQGDTATVKVQMRVGADLFLTTNELGTAIYRTAIKHPEANTVVGILWLSGQALDQYGKPFQINEEFGRIELDADEIRKYATEDAYMNRRRDILKVWVFDMGRKWRTLFSRWKL
jgi:GYF domain 2